MESKYSSLAARRYRQYQRQKRKEFAKKKIISYLFKLFQAIVKALQKIRVLRRRNVETIIVE